MSHVRVLVVDDEPDLREAMCNLLESAGHAVTSASNGREALEWLKSSSGSPCLILLDLSMPVMDGWEFRQVQLGDETLAAIPVLVITADGNAPEKAARLAAQGFLRKPFRPDDLLREVEKFCSGSEAQFRD
jgi:CheY-like chemotaxis protein